MSCLVALLVFPFVGLGLVYAALAVPNGPQRDHLANSIEYNPKRLPPDVGASASLGIRQLSYLPRRLPSTLLAVGSAECRTIGFGLTDSRGNVRDGLPTLDDAVLAPVPGRRREIGCRNLGKMIFATDGELPARLDETYNYSRYWHGYSVITRPVLAVFSYTRLRQLVWTATFVLGAIAVWTAWRNDQARLAVALVAPVLSMGLFGVGQYVTFVWCWIIGLAAMIAVMRMDLHRASAPRKLYGTLLAAGVLTAYIDRLTIPIITLTLPLLALFMRPALTGQYAIAGDLADDELSHHEPAHTERAHTEPVTAEPGDTEPGDTEPANTEPGVTGVTVQERFVTQFWLGFWLSLTWAIGWLVTWASKLVIVGMFAGGSELDRARSAGVANLGGRAGYGFLAPLTTSLREFMRLTTTLDGLILVALVAAVVFVPPARARAVALLRRSPALVVVALLPAVWLMAFRGHSVRHPWVVYLDWYPSAVIGWLFLIQAIPRPGRPFLTR